MISPLTKYIYLLPWEPHPVNELSSKSRTLLSALLLNMDEAVSVCHMQTLELQQQVIYSNRANVQFKKGQVDHHR